MPIYRYGCEGCDKELEVIQSISGEALVCCGEPMRKLPTFPAKIEIKGKKSEGYKRDYAKDYRRRLQETVAQ